MTEQLQAADVPDRRMRTSGPITIRLVIVVLLYFLGLSEALATSPWFDPEVLPHWLALPIVMTGFFGVLFLWSFIGNAILAFGSFLVIWLVWRWPLWVAASVSVPFLIVTYRLSPKPW